MPQQLSFDPGFSWLSLPGVPGAEWSVEVFTADDAAILSGHGWRRTDEGIHVDTLHRPGGQREVPGSVSVRLDDSRDTMRWQITAEMTQPVKAVKLLLRGLPRHSTGWWSATTPCGEDVAPTPGTTLRWNYPWPTWQTPWACLGDGPAITLSIRDQVVAAKRLFSYTPPWSSTPVTEIICQQRATDRGRVYRAPEIQLRRCPDAAAIRADHADHLAYLEQAFGLQSWETRSDVPAWVRDVTLVVTLHGQHWTGHVFNTFDDMAHILTTISEWIPGRRVLAYLPGWEGRYYWQYPQYQPGEELGGEAGFARLVETAASLGVHLMPMFGANGANARRYPEWEDTVLRSPWNRSPAKVNHPDWDGDRSGEDDQVFCNPGQPAFRRLLVDQITALVQRHDIPGVFLDTSACWFDDPHRDVYQGYRALVSDLRDAVPDLLVCGEGWYDALLGVLPVNQTWLDVTKPTPLTTLPFRYGRLLGHLNTGCPGDGSTGVHEAGFRAPGTPDRVPGFIPSLGFANDTLVQHRDDVESFCKAAAVEKSGLDDGDPTHSLAPEGA